MFSQYLIKEEKSLIKEISKEKNIFKKIAKATKLNALLAYMANNAE